MNNPGWVVAAALAGFFFGAGTILNAESSLNAKTVELGIFTNGGHAYRLVEIKP